MKKFYTDMEITNYLKKITYPLVGIFDAYSVYLSRKDITPETIVRDFCFGTKNEKDLKRQLKESKESNLRKLIK